MAERTINALRIKKQEVKKENMRYFSGGAFMVFFINGQTVAGDYSMFSAGGSATPRTARGNGTSEIKITIMIMIIGRIPSCPPRRLKLVGFPGAAGNPRVPVSGTAACAWYCRKHVGSAIADRLLYEHLCASRSGVSDGPQIADPTRDDLACGVLRTTRALAQFFGHGIRFHSVG